MTIKRIFLSSLNYDHPQRGMIHAFEGIFGKENVRHFDFLERMRATNWGAEQVNDEFIDQAVKFQPDWAWLQLQNTGVITKESLDILRKKIPKCVLSHWSGDVRENIGDYFSSICKSTHLSFVANRGYLEKYLEAGAKEALYVAHGLDWEEDVLGLPEWNPSFEVPDVVYCGNNYGEKMVGSPVREAAIRAVKEAGIKIGIVGSGWESTGLPVIGTCKVKQQVQVYRRAKVILSVNHFPDLAGYHGDRTITAMASATPVIQRYFPGLENEFMEGENLLVFRSPEELVEKMRGLLESEDERIRIGRAGRRHVLLYHTWFSRIFQVLPRVEEIARSL